MRRFVLMAACAGLFAAGCRCPGAAPRPSPAAADADWLEGRLPDSVAQGTPRPGGELTVQIFAEPASLNHLVDADSTTVRIVHGFVYQGLIAIDPYDDPDYRHIPALAERWEVSGDGRVYTFHLRRGVTFHDGTPFTARDVVATFDKIQDPETKAAHVRAYTGDLEGYAALDDHTVRFTWARPSFLTLDFFAEQPILPAHVLEALDGRAFNEAAQNPLNRHPVGTGPLRFVTWRSGERIVLERNEAYWGRKAYLDRITFRLVKDPVVALALAERGELDVVTRIVPQDWVRMDAPALRERFHRWRFHEAGYTYVGWNAARPLFSDSRVRRAMTLLIDRPGLIEKLMHGLPRATACEFYWKGPDCPEDVRPLAYDPEEAAALLREAGWVDSDKDGLLDRDGAAFRFTLAVPASSVDLATLGTKMKEDLGRAGIQVSVQKVEWSALLGRLRRHEFDACALAWTGGLRMDPWQIWHSSSVEGGSNWVGFSNPEADALIEAARSTLDDAPRHALYHRLVRLLHAEQPYTWLYVRPRLELLSRRVKGARPGLMYWQWHDFWIEEPAPVGEAP